jgi:hypothetical protein
MYYSNSYVYPDYLCHYGVLGMKWGQHLFGKVSAAAANHKAKKGAIKSEQKNLISSYKAKDPASHMANKAAKAYYKSIRSDSKYYASKAKSKSERLQASLTDEQVKSGRYRVANARNIRRKVLSTSVAALTGAGTAAMAVSTGGLAAAVVLGAGSASITGVATNLISGGHYYAKEAKAYGSKRAKTQAKVNIAAKANSSSDDDKDND